MGGILGAAVLFLIGPGADGVAAQNFGRAFFGFEGPPQSLPQPAFFIADQPAVTPREDRRRRLSHYRRRPVRLARRAMCVRLCDGYAFPIGNYYNASERKRDEDMCASTFPELQTRLFVLPRGSESLHDAVAADDGDRYSALPTAFAYLKPGEQTSVCPRTYVVRKSTSPLQDVTLRRGDILMTSRGFRIFRGGPGIPHRPGDFMSLAQSGGLRSRVRNELIAMENVSVDRHLRAVPDLVSDGRVTPPFVAVHYSHRPRRWVQWQAAPGFEALN